ncbi:MAG TPA: YciI family protein [Candidatus Kapabacteria bacterium]|nr:YciI family protein [Candidatus Kapabacteria bacterium]
MKEYMLLFRGGNNDDFASPEAMQKTMALWKTWMDDLAKQQRLGAAQPLKPEGKLVKGAKKQVVDGPFTEGKEIVGGYLLLKAEDIQEAVELSKGCPALQQNGIVEVREIQELTM